MSIILKSISNIADIIPKKIRVKITNKAISYLIKKYANIRVENREVIESRIGKPTVYIGNHLSNIDGVLLNKLLKENNIKFMAGVKLSKNPLTNLVMETISTIAITPNSADKTAIKEAVGHLKEGGSIFIFPEGTRSRTGEMIRARKGFLLIAKMAGVSVVSIGLEGTEKLLPAKDEMGDEKFHPADVKIIVGKPFSILEKTPENKENWTELANEDAMKKIAGLLNEKYRGIYK